jgi:hypothetical protein
MAPTSGWEMNPTQGLLNGIEYEFRDNMAAMIQGTHDTLQRRLPTRIKFSRLINKGRGQTVEEALSFPEVQVWGKSGEYTTVAILPAWREGKNSLLYESMMEYAPIKGLFDRVAQSNGGEQQVKLMLSEAGAYALILPRGTNMFMNGIIAAEAMSVSQERMQFLSASGPCKSLSPDPIEFSLSVLKTYSENLSGQRYFGIVEIGPDSFNDILPRAIEQGLDQILESISDPSERITI